MLGKLLKYEFKSTARIFIPLYITLLVVALINGFFINTELYQVQGILTMVFVALMIAMFVITIIVLIQRFSKNLLGDEGYLIFTLPVSSTSILLSKYFVVLIWTVLSGIVAFLAFCLMTLLPLVNEIGMDFSYYLNTFIDLFKTLVNEGFLSYVINMLLLMFLGFSAFVFTVYLSLAMGQLPIFNKHRNLASFISFIGINILVSFVQNLIGSFLFNNIGEQLILSLEANPVEGFTSLVSGSFLAANIFNLVTLIVLFLATKYILDRKLNLE